MYNNSIVRKITQKNLRWRKKILSKFELRVVGEQVWREGRTKNIFSLLQGKVEKNMYKDLSVGKEQ